MTLDQIKKDIQEGRSRRIYYSSNTLWWTHLEADVEKASELGRAAQERSQAAMMNNTGIPDHEKQRIKRLYEQIKTSSRIPLDITGAPLMMMDNCMRWIDSAEAKPDHFGKHGLLAFIKAHHQNCEGRAYAQWAPYNEMIDDQKK